MKRNQSAKHTALSITHRTVAIVAGLSLITGSVAGAATVAITAPAQAQEQATAAQGQGQPGGGMQGGADTMSFDYSGSYAGAIAADGEGISSDGESFTATEADQNAALGYKMAAHSHSKTPCCKNPAMTPTATAATSTASTRSSPPWEKARAPRFPTRPSPPRAPAPTASLPPTAPRSR